MRIPNTEIIKAKLNPFMPYLLKAKEPWLVGGAIRDAILGLPFKDFDFAIKDSGVKFAKWFAHQIKGSFVLLDEKNDEARVVYKRKLTFDFNGMDSIEDDLARRDFRLNAMALKLPGLEIFDPFNGMKDIEKKRIRMVSEKSLLDDSLRILRGFRFGATLGFSITPETLKTMKNGANLLTKIAPERIRVELFGILSAQNSYQTLRQMAKLEILDTIIPEIKPMREVAQGKPGGNLLDHSILTVKEIETLKGFDPKFEEFKGYFEKKMPVLKISALLHDIGKPYCYSENELGRVHFYGHEEKGVKLLANIRKELRMSNSEFRTIETLIRYHMRPHLLVRAIPSNSIPREGIPTDKAVWRLVRDGGDETPGILLLAYADALASGGKGKKKLLNLLKKGMSILEDMRRPKFKRLLTGDDLIALGFKPGPGFKKILQTVEEAQVSGELHTHSQALQFVRQKWGNQNDR